MDIQDVERFIAGSHEIDRKHEVIKKVVASLRSLLETHIKRFEKKYREKGWFLETILKWPLLYGDLEIKVSASRNPSSKISVEIRLPGGSAENIRTYYENVPILYDKLPLLIEVLDEYFPDAGIKKHFEFFTQQAPVK